MSAPKRRRKWGQRLKASPQTKVELLWASGVKPEDIIGIWYSPSDDSWFVSEGDWAAEGTGDKVRAVFGPRVALADEGVPNTTSDEAKFSVRLKDSGYNARAGQTIRGNLARGNDGKFTAAGNASAAAPKRGIVLSKQPKPPARPKPSRATAPKKGGGGGTGPKPKDPAIAARQAQRDQEHAADRAQRQADRQARLARQAQRDQEHDQDRAGKRAAQQIAQTLAKQPKAAKPAKPAKGGGGSTKPSADDKRRAQSQRALDTAGEVGLAAGDLETLRQAAAGLGGAHSDQLTKLGLIGSDGLTTDQGRRALSAIERGDVRGYQAALQDATARMGRETARSQAQAARTQAAAARTAKARAALDRLARRAKAGTKLTQAQRDQLTDAGMASESGGMWRVKGSDRFVVFKDHAGNHRWIARTTTAYRDRDGEIISEAALDADSQRMMATKQFGPLRYWHIGQPDPANLAAPWGPGLDIGDCDYSVVIGRTRIESGTFRDAAIAAQLARVAHRHEMSPGFLHPLDQPDGDKVFHAIHTFERSPVPVRYGRASNLFTGFTVKECRMEVVEMERRFKAMYQELGLTPEQAVELGQGLIATEKAASAQGIAFKDAAPPHETIYYGPNNQPGIIQDGAWVALKAAMSPPPMDAEDDPALGGDGGIDEAAEGEPPMDDAQTAGDYLGDMSWDEFAQKLGALLAPVLKMQDMVKSIGDAHAELKGMYGGVAQKDDARAAELTSLKSQYAALAQKIGQIEGDQPSVVLPDEVAAALKSAGPAESDPHAVQVPNDPTRPLAAIAARTMPSLYATNPDGGFAGWTPPPVVGS
jgi:hypothetical protein